MNHIVCHVVVPRGSSRCDVTPAFYRKDLAVMGEQLGLDVEGSRRDGCGQVRWVISCVTSAS